MYKMKSKMRNKTKKHNKYNKYKVQTKKNKTKNVNKNKKYYKTKKNRRGGKLNNNCKAELNSYPKCGKEGCVFLVNDNEVSKEQWKNDREMFGYMLSTEGQTVAQEKNLAPTILEQNIKPCNLVSKIGFENKGPCIVKRRRKTRSGEKISYEEEVRDSWCRNYGVNDQCVVDDIMYNKLKTDIATKPLFEGPRTPPGVKIPDIDTSLDGEVDAISDEELGDMWDKPEIDKSFTNFQPIFLTTTKMDRIKGITIAELITEMVDVLGYDQTMEASKEWEKERDQIIQQVNQLGYTSNDFNESNIMIDVDNESLCSWIDEMLSQKQLITPQKIKEHFGKENILKIVDWGMLQKTKNK